MGRVLMLGTRPSWSRGREGRSGVVMLVLVGMVWDMRVRVSFPWVRVVARVKVVVWGVGMPELPQSRRRRLLPVAFRLQ